MDVMDEILALQDLIEAGHPNMDMGRQFRLRELKQKLYQQQANAWYRIEYASWNGHTRRDIIRWCANNLPSRDWLIYQPLGASEVLLMRHKSDAILCKLSVESLGGKKI